MLGGFGALIILLFVFGTPAADRDAVAHSDPHRSSTTFPLILRLTQLTDVSIIIQFLVALVGLGVSIDYALVMIFRFREELPALGRPTTRSSRR